MKVRSQNMRNQIPHTVLQPTQKKEEEKKRMYRKQKIDQHENH